MCEADACCPAPGVAGHIGQRLLHEAKKDELHIRIEPLKVGSNIQIDRNAAALHIAFHKGTQRQAETGLVQQRRVKQVGNRAHLADRSLEHLLELTERRKRALRHRVLDAAHDQGGRNQILAGAVMQVAGDAPAFLVLRPHQRSGELTGGAFRALELVDQGPQQQDRNRQAGEKELQRQHAAPGIGVGKQASAVQRAPGQDHGDDKDCLLYTSRCV